MSNLMAGLFISCLLMKTAHAICYRCGLVIEVADNLLYINKINKYPVAKIVQVKVLIF